MYNICLSLDSSLELVVCPLLNYMGSPLNKCTWNFDLTWKLNIYIGDTTQFHFSPNFNINSPPPK